MEPNHTLNPSYSKKGASGIEGRFVTPNETKESILEG